jgi:hypothetical protein
MLPRWFRAVIVAEIAGLAAFVVLGVHVIGQGVHSASSALAWLRPGSPHPSSPPLHKDALPTLLTSTAAPPPHGLMSYGAAILSPSLLVRLNRDTGATAVGEYTLLLNLEALARDEITRLLGTVSVAPPAGTGAH